MSLPRSCEQAGILRSALFGVAAALLNLHSAPAVADIARLIEQGRRIYVDGILPDGSRLSAIRFAGASVAGAEAACVHCHRPSGYGAVEGRILVPPVAGAVLFAPGVFSSGGGTHSAVSAIERFRGRSAYTEKKLMRALRDGIDPDGVPLRPPMARYRLDAKATKALAAYLRQLSGGPAPGIVGQTLHLGTVITPDVPPEERDALLEVLRGYAAMSANWDMHWQLHVWQLTGAPQEWEAQLEAFYRHQPVFALLSGAGTVEWQPVHRFCEQRAVACVLPSVELAPDNSGYYSLYFSGGIALEARLLAHHLTSETVPPQRLFQLVADDAGERAAEAMQQALEQAASTIKVQRVTVAEYAAMAPLSAGDAVVWWLRPRDIDALATALPGAVAPGMLYLSSVLAPPEKLTIPDGWKQALRYVSFFDALAERRAQAVLVPWLERQGLAATELRVRGDAYAACNFFNSAISALQLQSASGIKGPLTRERLLEAFEASMTIYRDDAAPYYWQMSLGPTQRTLVKGGMLLGYSQSDGEEWKPLTARIVP